MLGGTAIQWYQSPGYWRVIVYVYNALMHQHIEPGTKAAFDAYVSCLHQLYLFGAAMQLKRMSYHMTKMN